MQENSRYRVFIVDDHPVVRDGLKNLIEQEEDLVVCGEAEEAMGAMHVLASARPDVLILDISLSGPDGMDLLKMLRTTHPTLPVLILSMHDELIYAERALRAGANGYIMKQEATEQVTVVGKAIEAAAEEGKSVWVLDRPNPAGRPVEGLTLIFGIDRFMSEARAITNFIGNGVATVFLANNEKEFDRQKMDRAFNYAQTKNPEASLARLGGGLLEIRV